MKRNTGRANNSAFIKATSANNIVKCGKANHGHFLIELNVGCRELLMNESTGHAQLN